MDEFIFRSSQKLDYLQIRLSLVASHSKDIFYQYSQQSKSLIVQAWNSDLIVEIKENIKALFHYVTAIFLELNYKVFFYVDPVRLYFGLVKFIGKKWTKREVIFGIGGFLFGGAIGLVIGLTLKRPKYSVRYMQAIQCTNYKGLESVSVVEDAVASYECGNNEVIIDVKAASVDRIDYQICYGYGKTLRKILRQYYENSQSEFPITLGRSCAGVITDMGRDVKRLEIGDEVYLAVPFWSQGTLSQTFLVSESRVARKPRNAGFEGASSIPYAGCIALSVLKEANLTKKNAVNKRVLVHDAVSPVGCVLIQILKYWGAEVTGTCYKRAVPVVKALGTDDVIILNENLLEVNMFKCLLIEFDSREKFDTIILTNSCTLPNNELRNYCLGKILSTFNLNLSSDEYSFIVRKCLKMVIWIRDIIERVFKIPLYEYDEAHMCYLPLDQLTELIENNHLQTVVGKVFPSQDIDQALEHIESNKSIGSTIISFK